MPKGWRYLEPAGTQDRRGGREWFTFRCETCADVCLDREVSVERRACELIS
jgi:hypothetical protein